MEDNSDLWTEDGEQLLEVSLIVKSSCAVFQ